MRHAVADLARRLLELRVGAEDLDLGRRPRPSAGSTSITCRSTPPCASGLRGVTISTRGAPPSALGWAPSVRVGLGDAGADPQVVDGGRGEPDEDHRRAAEAAGVAAQRRRRGRAGRRAAACGGRRCARRRGRRRCRPSPSGPPSSGPRRGSGRRSSGPCREPPGRRGRPRRRGRRGSRPRASAGGRGCRGRSPRSRPGGVPTRPSSWLKPPTSSSGARRKDMLAPTRLRTGRAPAASRSGCSRRPSRTRPGTSPACPRPSAGATRAADAEHVGVGVGGGQALRASRGRRSRRRRGRRRPRRSPRRRRCCARPERPCGSRLATIFRSGQRRARLAPAARARGRSRGRSRAAAASAPATSRRASPITSSRSAVKAQITDRDRRAGGGALSAGLALHRRDSGRPDRPSLMRGFVRASDDAGPVLRPDRRRRRARGRGPEPRAGRPRARRLDRDPAAAGRRDSGRGGGRPRPHPAQHAATGSPAPTRTPSAATRRRRRTRRRSVDLRRVLRRERPEVVHAHNWIVHSYLPLARGAHSALALSLHDYGLICATKRLRRKDERLLRAGAGQVPALRRASTTAPTKGLVAAFGTRSLGAAAAPPRRRLPPGQLDRRGALPDRARTRSRG